jgi:hypothetical protein
VGLARVVGAVGWATGEMAEEEGLGLNRARDWEPQGKGD